MPRNLASYKSRALEIHEKHMGSEPMKTKVLIIVVMVVFGLLLIAWVAFLPSAMRESEPEVPEQSPYRISISDDGSQPDIARDRKNHSQILSTKDVQPIPLVGNGVDSNRNEFADKRKRLHNEMLRLREEIHEELRSNYNYNQRGVDNVHAITVSNSSLKKDVLLPSVSKYECRPEDKNGFVSATPVENIADPVNPKPGMLFSAYNYPDWMQQAQLKDSNSMLPKMVALKSGVDKSEGFSIKCSTGVNAGTIRWEGFIKCSMARTYTFLIKRSGSVTGWNDGYSVKINGKIVITSWGENSFDADLKVGWNKIEIVCQFDSKGSALELSARTKGSFVKPTQFSPAMMFYDDKPELTPPNPFR